eukprot:NODE_5404_length_709_cov_16.678788_g4552_i0.p1 GENE.NODE_5404_length_709_cov_16.678788_g4552_i0~~NODE_5404_length_709_cov_16.678788_g4552_i0.p1  ORF type:complete len:149 (-),score=40.29 NODE_5404_length_709_cov_16.678788_g4552_i0:84-530(-)
MAAKTKASPAVKKEPTTEVPTAPFDPLSMVKLMSNDGFEFVVDKSVVCQSRQLQHMLEEAEGTDGSTEQLLSAGDGPDVEVDAAVSEAPRLSVLTIPQATGQLLEFVIQYLYYKKSYDHLVDPEARPKFPIPEEHSLPLMLLAYYLEV